MDTDTDSSAGAATTTSRVAGLATATDNCSVESFTNDAPAVFAKGETIVTGRRPRGREHGDVLVERHHRLSPSSQAEAKPHPKPCPKPKPKHPKH